MEEHTLFSIGDLAKICQTTHKTLRLLDQNDLVKPALINPKNGYHYYTKWHIERVQALKQLMKTGISLKDMEAVIHQKYKGCNMETLFLSYENDLQNQISRLQNQLKQLQTIRVQWLKNKEVFAYHMSTDFLIQHFPSRRVLLKASPDPVNHPTFFTAYEAMIQTILKTGNLKQQICSSPVHLYYLDDFFKPIQSQIGFESDATVTLPYEINVLHENNFACFLHRGDCRPLRDQILPELIEKLKKKGYQILSPLIEYYYVHEAVTTNKEQYLTEIQIPVSFDSR